MVKIVVIIKLFLINFVLESLKVVHVWYTFQCKYFLLWDRIKLLEGLKIPMFIIPTDSRGGQKMPTLEMSIGY